MRSFLRGARSKLRSKFKRRSKETLRPTSPECVDEASTRCTESNKDPAPVASPPAPVMAPTSNPPVVPSSVTTTGESTGSSALNLSAKLAQKAPIDDNGDIWHKAYAKFVEREMDLADDYRKHLAADSTFLSPTDAKTVVERLQEERQAKQWKFTFYGKDVNFRAQVEKMAKALLWCDSIVKSALSTQPHAALAWSGVSICLPLLTNASAKHETMISGFDSIQRVIVYWKIYQDTFPDDFKADNKSDSHNNLVNLYSHIFEFQARVICHLSSTQLSRAWQNVAGWNDWETKASHVNNLSDECKKCTDISRAHEAQEKCDQQLKEMFESRKALQEIHRIMVEANQQRLDDRADDLERNLLEHLAANHEAYKNFNPPKVEGTCAWLLEDPDFRLWREGMDSRLLLLFAGPGCGKSVLTRSMIDDWQLNTSATTSMVCHFFFKDGDAERIHSHDALAAILHQVFIQDLTGKFLGTALDRHKKYGNKLAENFDQLWDILLDCASTPDAGEIVCVLDAFDECLKDERGSLITKLQEFFSNNGAATQRHCRLKFLITSRPYDTIESPLRQLLKTSCLRIDGEDHSDAIAEDINRVIDATLPKLLGGLSAEEQKRVSDQLKDMENRTYLWLRLTFGIIEDNPSDFGRGTDVNRIIQKLPKGHAEAYEAMLNKKCNETFTRPLLGIILAANQPLSLDEANIALAVAVGNPPDLIDPWPKDSFESHVKNFGGLLVSTHDWKVQFLHQTVREFLTEKPQDEREWTWGGSFSSSEYHKTIARSCILLLSSPNLFSPLDKPANFCLEFFQYAAQHWWLHLRESGDEIDTELLEKAVGLCHPVEKNVAWFTSYRLDLDWLDWPVLKTAALLGLAAVVRAIIGEGGVDINATSGDFGTALHVASEQGFEEVVNILLDHGADVNISWGGRSPIYTASLGGHYAVAQLLFDKCTDRIEISMDDLIEAAYHFREEEIEGLLKSLVGKLMLTPQNLAEACASSKGCYALALLARYRGKEIHVTPEMIVMAARNGDVGRFTMAQLLEAWNDQIEITPEILHEAAQNFDTGVMHVLLQELERRQIQIEVNEEIFIAAATNEIGHCIVPQLFRLAGAENAITPRVLAAAASNEGAGVQIMGILFEKKGFQIEMTPEVISAAEMNEEQGKWVLELIGIFRQNDKDSELILQEIAKRQAQLIKHQPWIEARLAELFMQ